MDPVVERAVARIYMSEPDPDDLVDRIEQRLLNYGVDERVSRQAAQDVIRIADEWRICG